MQFKGTKASPMGHLLEAKPKKCQRKHHHESFFDLSHNLLEGTMYISSHISAVGTFVKQYNGIALPWETVFVTHHEVMKDKPKEYFTGILPQGVFWSKLSFVFSSEGTKKITGSCRMNC
jgi:hypothetical protein